MGTFAFMTVEPARPPRMASKTFSGFTPAMVESEYASAQAAMLQATMIWFASFTVLPAPLTSPQWTAEAPIVISSSWYLSNSAFGPPHMIESVPSIAFGSPPETGASIMWMPCLRHSAAMALDSSGAMELMSITSRPSFAPSATPFSPRTAARTCGELGTMVMTTSLFEATSALLSPRFAPQLTTSSSASFANGSNAMTS